MTFNIADRESRLKLKGKCGIYQITNTINGKKYIGSSDDMNRRLSKHYNDLIKNKHSNPHLQAAYNKYKSNNFLIDVVVYTSKNLKKITEQWFLDNEIDWGKDYNIVKQAFLNSDYKFKESTRIRIEKKYKKFITLYLKEFKKTKLSIYKFAISTKDVNPSTFYRELKKYCLKHNIEFEKFNSNFNKVSKHKKRCQELIPIFLKGNLNKSSFLIKNRTIGSKLFTEELKIYCDIHNINYEKLINNKDTINGKRLEETYKPKVLAYIERVLRGEFLYDSDYRKKENLPFRKLFLNILKEECINKQLDIDFFKRDNIFNRMFYSLCEKFALDNTSIKEFIKDRKGINKTNFRKHFKQYCNVNNLDAEKILKDRNYKHYKIFNKGFLETKAIFKELYKEDVTVKDLSNIYNIKFKTLAEWLYKK